MAIRKVDANQTNSTPDDDKHLCLNNNMKVGKGNSKKADCDFL